MELSGAPGGGAPVSLAIRLRDVSKSYGATAALRDVSFDIQQGRAHALLGGNGSGKSTLIKIMAGVVDADAGSIEVNGFRVEASKTNPDWAREAGLHFVHQSVGTFPDMTVAENFALGRRLRHGLVRPVNWRTVHREAAEVLGRFEIDVSTKSRMGELRPATQTLVAVARALQDEDEAGRGVLILDEPTAALPSDQVNLVLDAIRGYTRRGHTVVLVSHRLDEVLGVCDDATFLRDGRHVQTTTLAGATKRDLVSRIAAQEHLTQGRNHSASRDEPVRLEVQGMSGGPLRGIDLAVRRGEVLGLSGLLGSGRSTLLKSLFGVHAPSAGRVTIDGRAHNPKNPDQAIRSSVAYVPEDRARDSLFADRSVTENLSIPRVARYWRAGRLAKTAEQRDAEDSSSRHGVVVASVTNPISSLSGGNQQKVIIARWLELQPDVLLLDEPTQGVDVGARAAIHQLIRDAASHGCAVLVVSSDAGELAEVCDRVVGLVDGRIVGEVSGEELTEAACLHLAYRDELESIAQSSQVRGSQ